MEEFRASVCVFSAVPRAKVDKKGNSFCFAARLTPRLPFARMGSAASTDQDAKAESQKLAVSGERDPATFADIQERLGLTPRACCVCICCVR